MEILEFNYKKPIYDVEVALYKIIGGDYVEISGGGYARQKYNDHSIKFPFATADWGVIEVVGFIFNQGRRRRLVVLANPQFVGTGNSLTLNCD